jgi:hypothetical protein
MRPGGASARREGVTPLTPGRCRPLLETRKTLTGVDPAKLARRGIRGDRYEADVPTIAKGTRTLTNG